MTKKQRALEMIERLKKEYPDAGCTLDYNEAWKLLVSVRLAAQCTDARVNVVVEKLYEKFPDVNALAEAPVEEIEEIVKPCGLGHSKARDISACMKILRDEYDGNVPDDFDKLLKLPGVGRKSANLIMGDVFGQPAIVTDTHCIRLTNRMGLVDRIKEPAKVEKELWKIIPPEEGSDFCHRLVFHGREVCTARTKPYCDRCCICRIFAKRPAYRGGRPMRMYDIIMKKRNGGELTEEEINFLVQGYTKGEIPDYQVSALMMAIFFRHMTEKETLYLTMAMANSEETGFVRNPRR